MTRQALKEFEIPIGRWKKTSPSVATTRMELNAADEQAVTSQVRIRAKQPLEISTFPPADVDTVAAFIEWMNDRAAREMLGPLEAQMARCLRRADYDGALVAASVIAYHDPKHAKAKRAKMRCARIVRSVVSRSTVTPNAPVLMAVGWESLRARPLTHDQAFVLSLVDGLSTIEETVEASALPLDVAHAVLRDLGRLGLVELRA